MKLIYYPQPRLYEPGDRIILPEPLAHHCKRVLRLRSGDSLKLSDGTEAVYDGTLLVSPEATREAVSFVVTARQAICDDRPRIFLHVSPIQKPLAESLLRHSAELGLYSLVWTLYERSEPHWIYAHHESRFQKILEEACKSTGRPLIPQMHAPLPFAQVIASAQGTHLFGHTDPACTQTLAELALPQDSQLKHNYHLWIGPEGDLSEHEIAQLRSLGAMPITLGRYIYKVDIASLKAIIELQFRLSSLGQLV